MSSSTADGSRALYGISKAGMTIKQLGVLNRYNVPGRAMTVDLVVNCLLVLFISSNLAILYMSNIGYVLAHLLAVSGFLLLRKDRPNWPRPIKVGADLDPDRLVHDGPRRVPADRRRTRAAPERLRHVDGLRDRRRRARRLGAAVHLPAVVQDGEKIHFREETPTMPGRGMASIRRRPSRRSPRASERITTDSMRRAGG